MNMALRDLATADLSDTYSPLVVEEPKSLAQVCSALNV